MRRIRIRRFGPEGEMDLEDWVAEEGLLELTLVPERTARFVLTPDKIEAFVYGHLLGEGLIKSREDVLSYREELNQRVGVPGEVIRVEVTLSRTPVVLPAEGIVWSACGRTVSEPGFDLQARTAWPLVAEDALIAIPRVAPAKAEGFRLTGAYHYAFLFSPEPRLLCWAEDIGRHNAVDKALGEAILSGVDLRETILYTTGRISAEIVLKALRAGVPVVCSRGAALLGAISLARRYNLGLVGFLRGTRFNLYSGAEWLRRRPKG